MEMWSLTLACLLCACLHWLDVHFMPMSKNILSKSGSSSIGQMAFSEQAALLSAAWANIPELAERGAKNSLCVVTSKKITRSFLHA